jgi:pseudaminic acid cytidylyltransferase
MRIAIIPARGGSKRIKNKNIIDFLGKPLIAYALEAAKKSNLFDVIHVSTDSLEICDVVEKLGYKIDFLRSNELADDHTGLVPVIQWVHKEYEKRGQHFDDICCIMPAAPLLNPNDLIDGFTLYEKFNKKNPLFVVAPFPVPIEWAFYREEDTKIIARNADSLIVRSQDIKPAFYEAGPFSILNASHLHNSNALNKEQYISLLLDKSRAVDIDDAEDLELAKILYLGAQSLNTLSKT